MSQPVLSAEHVSMVYRKAHQPAVDDVSLDLFRGEIVGLVGESGCGKSTLARCLVGAQQATAGRILLDGQPLVRRTPAQRRGIQMVFQDPYAALNPSLRIGTMLEELVRVHRLTDSTTSARRERITRLLAMVGLGPEYLDAYARQLSGGQRQRVNIARALALEPEVIVADEVVSALDASVQASILALLLGLREQAGVSILFISHNLAVVRQICDRVAVMKAGRIVESSVSELLFSQPSHSYTRELLAAVPRL